MSVHAKVKKIVVGGGLFGGDTTENYNTYIAETSDLSNKVDTSTLNSNISNVKDLISDEKSERKQTEATITNSLTQVKTDLSKKADVLVVENKIKEITDCNRLAQEKAALEKLFSEQIIKIQNVCSEERKKISAEIKVFQSIDLNKDLEKKLMPFNNILAKLEDKMNFLTDDFKKLNILRESISQIDRQIQTHKNDANSILSKISVYQIDERFSKLKKKVDENFDFFLNPLQWILLLGGGLLIGCIVSIVILFFKL